MPWADNSKKIDRFFPLAIPNHISLISTYVPSLFEIPRHLLKLWSWNENMGVSWADNYQNLKIYSNPKPDLHNINAHTKFDENPLLFTQVIIQKQKYGRTMEGVKDRHTDVQSETVIPHHYHVAR